MNTAAGSSMKFPPGVIFEPDDDELINYYLMNRVSKGPDFLFSSFIPDCPEFFNEDPWNLWESNQRDDRNRLYFFTLRKKLKDSEGGGTRCHRKVGSGTWTNLSCKDIPNTSGRRRDFRYMNSRNVDQDCAWLMTEYELSANQDWVICQLRPSPKNTTVMTTSNKGSKRKRNTGAASSGPKRNLKAGRKPKQAPINPGAITGDVVVVEEEQEHQPQLVVPAAASYGPDNQGLDVNDYLDEIDQQLMQTSEGQDQLLSSELYQQVLSEFQNQLCTNQERAVDHVPNGVDGKILADLQFVANQDDFNGDGDFDQFEYELYQTNSFFKLA